MKTHIKLSGKQGNDSHSLIVISVIYEFALDLNLIAPSGPRFDWESKFDVRRGYEYQSVHGVSEVPWASVH